MRINNEKITPLVLKYQNTKDNNILKEIIKESSNMIYNYPHVVFHKDIDDCSEFYIYFIQRLYKLLLKYKPALSSFNTWFNIVLKSQCINWLNKLTKTKKSQINTISINENCNEISKTKDNTDDKNIISISVINIINSLNIFDYLIIKLLYFDIDKNLLIKLSHYNKKTIKKNVESLNNFINNNKKFKLQKKLTEKIDTIQYKIYNLKQKIDESLDDDHILNKINKHFEDLKIFKNKLSNHYQNFDIASIASILNTNIREVYYRLSSIKKNIYNKLKNKINTRKII